MQAKGSRRNVPLFIVAVIGFISVAFASPSTTTRENKVHGETRVVFTAKVQAASDADQQLYQIFSMRTDGTGLIQLTDNAFDNCDPHWIGGPIVMERGRHDWDNPKWEIWIMDADGGNERLLAAVPEGALYCFNPRISPDGKRVIYFVTWGADHNILHLIDLENGSDQTIPLPDDAQWSIYWHPDGQSLIMPVGQGSFWSESSYALQRFDLNTGQVTELIPADGRTSWSGQVSPDGAGLVFHQNVVGGSWDEREIRVMNLADGVLSEPLARAVRFDRDPRPTWSPDGQFIYYNATLTEGDSVRTTIFRIPADGTGAAVELTGLPGGSRAGVPNVALVELAPGIPAAFTVKIHEVFRSENVMDLTAMVSGATEPIQAKWVAYPSGSDASMADRETILTPQGLDITVTFLSPGTYDIMVHIVDADGATGSASITLGND